MQATNKVVCCATVLKFFRSVHSVPLVQDLKENRLSVFVPLYRLVVVLFILPLTFDREKGVMSKADRQTAPAIVI